MAVTFEGTTDLSHIVSALEVLAACGTPVRLGGALEYRPRPDLRLVTASGARGERRVTVTVSGTTVLDVLVIDDHEVRVQTYAAGPWVAQVYLSAVKRRWSIWGKPAPVVPVERQALQGRPAPSPGAGPLVRRIASTVAKTGVRDLRDGLSATLETPHMTAGLVLVKAEAILMIHGDRGLGLVAVLDRKPPHRLLAMTCYKPGAWLRDLAQGLDTTGDFHGFTTFCGGGA